MAYHLAAHAIELQTDTNAKRHACAGAEFEQRWRTVHNNSYDWRKGTLHMSTSKQCAARVRNCITLVSEECLKCLRQVSTNSNCQQELQTVRVKARDRKCIRTTTPTTAWRSPPC